MFSEKLLLFASTTILAIVTHILFICPYPLGRVPSQRFRFEQYTSQLREKGFQTVARPFLSERAYLAVYQSGNIFSKIHAIIESYLGRLTLLFQMRRFDIVFLHREATPAGPPFVEFAIARILKKKIIYDFDDAIWLTDRRNEHFLASALAWRRKVASICRWSYRVSCGNPYLADFARKYNQNVIVNPTTIDPALHTPRANRVAPDQRVTVGWTGSRSTMKYLDGILPVLQAVEKKFPAVRWLVISDRKPQLPLQNLEFRPWRRDSEIDDLADIDIGIMPLPDDPWTRGKCGFKALQYMAMGIPAIVSPVGVNRDVVTDGMDGYCCVSFQDWFSAIGELMADAARRKEMGERGRKKVMDNYSVSANSVNFLSLFL